MWKMLSGEELKEFEKKQALATLKLPQGGCCQIQQNPSSQVQQQPVQWGPGNLIQTQAEKVALKYDSGKPDLSQVTLELVEELARVRMFGEKKYARDNWKKGFKVTRSISASLRHIFRFLSGETLDSESGLSHLGHAVACLEHAIWDMKHNPSNDDRYKGEAK